MPDSVTRHIERQGLSALVEDRTRQRHSTRSGDTFPLVDADVQQVANESRAIRDAQQRERFAALSRFNAKRLGLALPIRKALADADERSDWRKALARKRSVDLGAHGLGVRGRVDIHAPLTRLNGHQRH